METILLKESVGAIRRTGRRAGSRLIARSGGQPRSDLMKFFFEGVNAEGARQTGTVSAPSPEEARRRLHGKGIYGISLSPAPVDLEEERPNPLLRGWQQGLFVLRKPVEALRDALHLSRPLHWRRLPLETQLFLFRQLAVLVKAGIPLIRTLGGMAWELRHEPAGAVMGAIAEDLRVGVSLSAAFSKFPRTFSPRTVAMIAAGETGGTLHYVLDRLARSHESQLRQARSVANALLYPLLIFVLSLGIVVGLFSFTAPPLLELFRGLTIPLPPLTVGVLLLAKLLTNPLFIVLLLVGGAVTLYVLQQQLGLERARLGMEKLLFRVPWVRRVLSALITERFCRTLAELHESGVPFFECIRHAAETTGSFMAREELREISVKIARGEPLSAEIGRSWLFPSVLGSMVLVGESTGRLDEVLRKTGQYLEREVDLALEQVHRFLEPATLFVVGTAVGIFCVAFFLPIYGAIARMGG